MCTEKEGSLMKEMLKNLCCSNGWCYGVFWRFNQQNSLLLTLQDAYYEEQMGGLIDDMILQVHMLGEGLIGRAAFTKKHQYIFSDAHHKKQNLIGSVEEFAAFQDDSDFFGQFSTGIKTIAVIPVEPFGVIQFGSFQKLPESMEFVDQTKVHFSGIRNYCGLSGIENNGDMSGARGLFASLVSGENSQFASSGYLYGASEEELMEETFSLENPIQPLFSISNDQKKSCSEAQINFDDYIPSIEPQKFFPEPATLFDYTVDGAPWSFEDSARLSNTRESMSPVLCSENLISNLGSTPWLYSDKSELQGPTVEELLEEIETGNDFSRSCPMNEFSQLFSAMPDQENNMEAITFTRNLSYETGSTSVSSDFKEYVTRPSSSVQSSVTNLFSNVENEKNTDMSSSITNLFSNLENEKNADMSGIEKLLLGNLNNMSTPSVSGNHLDSQWISRPSNKLFSSSRINQRLEDVTSSSCSIAISSFEDQLSSANKRRKTDISLSSNEQMKFSSCSRFDGNKNSIHPLYNLDTLNNLGPEKTGLLIGDSYNIDAEKVSQRAKKKKAKSGTRPRPKDRQQIHDRLLELRKLVPNGQKMSIDGLLHQTIKQMVFLQSVTEHAERIKQTDESKDRKVPGDTSSARDCGVTWACEVGDETMACPLIVEDLNIPGQMSIEILCEERGSFLEIVDIVKGFGLIILKGTMEAREAKIYARFTVAAEGKRTVTRHEIFSSLVQLLQFTSSNGENTSDQLDDNVGETLQCGSL